MATSTTTGYLLAGLQSPTRVTSTTSAGAYGGSGSKLTTTTSIGQLLDLFIVHIVMTIIFVTGGIILIDRYANYAVKPYTALDDMFIASGLLVLLVNFIFITGWLVSLFYKEFRFLSRDDDSIHWLHALSIMAAVGAAIWGILALLLTFSSTLVATTTDNVEAAGYFMIMLTVVFNAYLSIRWMMSFAGQRTSVDQRRIDTTPDTFLGSYRTPGGVGVYSPSPTAAQPQIFGGSAPFGGLDLSALQPSSISAAPSPPSMACGMPPPMPGYGYGYPPPMPPGYGYGYYPPQPMGGAACPTSDPNAIRL